MERNELCPTNVDLLKRLLLDMSQERSVQHVLKLVVDRMASQPEVALARIWLIAPGDLCSTCHMRDECQRSVLVSPFGCQRGKFHRYRPRVDELGTASFVVSHSEFARSARLRHRVGPSKRQTSPNIRKSSRGPDWAQDEGIRALGGQPLIHQGEVLGVLAIFTRACLGEGQPYVDANDRRPRPLPRSLNARAFEEIGRLKEQLELERRLLA